MTIGVHQVPDVHIWARCAVGSHGIRVCEVRPFNSVAGTGVGILHVLHMNYTNTPRSVCRQLTMELYKISTKTHLQASVETPGLLYA